MGTEVKNTALISPKELALVPDNTLNPHQLKFLLSRTPEKYVKKRPAKGGGNWTYVTGGYIKKVLNLMFGFDWDFEIISEQVAFNQVIIKGKLTCRTNGKQIVKMQYGNKDIAYLTEKYKDEKGKEQKRPTDKPLDIGNDFKAAATDALKKCAAEIGIAADVYNSEEFRELNVDTSPNTELEDLATLFELKKESLTEPQAQAIQRIIDNKEENSYKKAAVQLQAL